MLYMKNHYVTRLAITLAFAVIFYCGLWAVSGFVSNYLLLKISTYIGNYPPLVLLPEVVGALLLGILAGIPFGYILNFKSFLIGLVMSCFVVILIASEFFWVLSWLHIVSYSLFVFSFSGFAYVGEQFRK